MALDPSLKSSVDLLVATLDLKLVSLLTGAIRNADANSRNDKAPFGVPETPAARYEPRPVIHPQPHYESRPVVYTHPARYRPIDACDKPGTDVSAATAPCAPKTLTSHALPSPIQPPWAVLPWPTSQSSHPAKVIKVLIARPDNTSRGTILDRFL